MQGIIDYDTQQPHIMGDSQESAAGLDTTVKTSDISPIEQFFSESQFSRDDAELLLKTLMVALLAYQIIDQRRQA